MAAVAVVAAGVALVAVTNAPPGPPAAGARYFALAGGGSDTTFDVLAAVARDVPELGSFDSRPGGSITTKDPQANPGCALARPAGDAAAVHALAAAQTQVRGTGAPACLDFARSTVDLSGAADLATPDWPSSRSRATPPRSSSAPTAPTRGP